MEVKCNIEIEGIIEPVRINIPTLDNPRFFSFLSERGLVNEYADAYACDAYGPMKGYSYEPDTSEINLLKASFIWEDTPQGEPFWDEVGGAWADWLVENCKDRLHDALRAAEVSEGWIEDFEWDHIEGLMELPLHEAVYLTLEIYRDYLKS